MARIEIKVPDWLDRICAWPAVVYSKSKYGYSFRRIYLDEEKWTIVDEQDYYRFGKYKWNVEGTNGKFYAIRGAQISPKEIKLVMLHRAAVFEIKCFFRFFRDAIRSDSEA